MIMIDSDTLGVIGGMGSIASAEFIKTIYECCNKDKTGWEAPTIFLLSDQTAPARNKGNIDDLEKFILSRVDVLKNMGISKVIVCCFVANVLLKNHKHLTCLIDGATKITDEDEEYIVLGSDLLVSEKLLDDLFITSKINRKVTYLPDDEQAKLSQLILAIKNSEETVEDINWLKEITADKSKKILVACAEIHVAHKKMGYACNIIDPFLAVARTLAG